MPTSNKNFFIEKRWALLAILLGTTLGFISAIICIAWNLIIFGFNIMYIVSPLLAGVVETTIARKKYGKSTGAISALFTFLLINGYGWFGPGLIFPKEPVTLSLITIIAIILTIQAAFPIFVNHILLVVVPGIFTRIVRVLVRTPSEMILKPLETEGKEIDRQTDEIFLDELTVPLVSIPDVNGEKIKSYIGLVVGESITQEKEPEERLLKILKIIEPTQLEDMNLEEARKGAISRMLENAESMGANAVVEVLIDYVSMGGLQGSVTIVTATGTAVIVLERDRL
ncbi:YbjQ family protein [Methanobacterium sp.]|uniref:YbjQ family protein n=1 Tax=Methanobacterium sp. TaxID=2164 RepID=UPI002ABB6747|nr:heavy metal-binding domain-containing protein [Methanobacterium sp.]MDY9922403.1 heavy metal-binding domain-containing protein [Methanobacterium sp.]